MTELVFYMQIWLFLRDGGEKRVSKIPNDRVTSHVNSPLDPQLTKMFQFNHLSSEEKSMKKVHLRLTVYV